MIVDLFRLRIPQRAAIDDWPGRIHVLRCLQIGLTQSGMAHAVLAHTVLAN